jgi:hypothetical protein
MTSRVLPNNTAVIAGGEQFTIREFGFGQIPAVSRHLAALFDNFGTAELNIPRLLAEGGEDVLAVLCLATGKPRDWFDTLPMDEGVNLLSAVITVNADTFQKKMLPALQGLLKQVVPQAPAATPVVKPKPAPKASRKSS